METLILIYALSVAFTLGLNSNMEASWLEKIVCSIFHAVFIPFVLAYAFGKWASEIQENDE